MEPSLRNQYTGVIVVSDNEFDLAEVISFLKKRDYSIFDFYSEYTAEDAEVYTKEALLFICNVSDNSIPEQTVIQVIDVLEHLDECIEQAYEWLAFGEWGKEWYKEKVSNLDIVKKRYRVLEICFGLNDWPESFHKICEEYCRGPEPQKGADVFSIEFEHSDCPLGFHFKFLCEDRRLYKFIIHIL